MNMQPVVHGSNNFMQPQAVTPANARKPKQASRKQSARAEAVRAAKAKISRRSSLRKQRQALKD